MNPWKRRWNSFEIAGGKGFTFPFWFFDGKLWGMGEALKLEGTIGDEGKVECPPVNLPKGTKVELVVTPLLQTDGTPKATLMDFFGKARGMFATPEEVLEHVRDLRQDRGEESSN